MAEGVGVDVIAGVELASVVYGVEYTNDWDEGYTNRGSGSLEVGRDDGDVGLVVRTALRCPWA